MHVGMQIHAPAGLVGKGGELFQVALTGDFGEVEVKPDVAFRGNDADAVEVRNYAKHFACHCHSLTLRYAAWGFSFLSREDEAKVPARLCQEESFRLLNCFGGGVAQV